MRPRFMLSRWQGHGLTLSCPRDSEHWLSESYLAIDRLAKGMKVGNKTLKVHLDGYNIMDALAGNSPSPRHEFFYFDDDGSLVAVRYNQWKVIFAEQRAHGFDVWQEP